MTQDEALYRAFLAELEAIERFRISYSGRQPHLPLGREDPDVRRMIEAMAMFTARTRRAAERGLNLSMLRLFRQHFPFLLSPVPSMGMLHARSSPRFVETAQLPLGSRILLTPAPQRFERAPEKQPSRFGYRTLRPLRVLPLELERLELMPLPGGGVRFCLAFAAAHERVDAIEQIDLFVNHLNDFASSLTVHHALRKHLVRASVVFDDTVREDNAGNPVSVRFGSIPVDGLGADLLAHPLERVRALLHFPQQAAFVTVSISGQPRTWRRFSVLFDLSPRWPRDLKLNSDTFQLHVTPMANLVRDMADPIAFDATRDRMPLLHPETAAKFRLHSVVGAYRLDRGEGLVPMRPGIVGERSQAYEVETDGALEERMGYLTLDAPEAFVEPFRVAVDANWFQVMPPSISASELTIALQDRYFDGLTWECLGSLSAPQESALSSDNESLLSLLALKNKRFLDREELSFVLRALGADKVAAFASLLEAISEVRVEQKPFARGSTGFKYLYHLTLGRLDVSDLPALELFLEQVLEVLRVWSIDEVVELTTRIPSLEQTLQLK